MGTAENKKLMRQIFTDSANRSGTTFVDHLADDVCWIITGQWSWNRRLRPAQKICRCRSAASSPPIAAVGVRYSC